MRSGRVSVICTSAPGVMVTGSGPSSTSLLFASSTRGVSLPSCCSRAVVLASKAMPKPPLASVRPTGVEPAAPAVLTSISIE